ncbi:MAG: 3-oxoacyl-ACP synthase III, partial [Planctomycetales bacterium]|nr:3-oxoacyl-ACP synthase III [Planctomycetales bacterium]
MRYSNVCLDSLGYVLPEERVTTAEIEDRLSPLYQRLRLPHGRLELMSGIRERRFFPAGVKPSDISVEAANRAIEASGIDRSAIGALVHGSVCRDFLEPATACRVHHDLGLPAECQVFDVSNACLGILTGAVQIANMIELGQIRAGVVVGTECGRTLVENTIERLNADLSLTRDSVKPWIASLTIGSASAAILLCDRELSNSDNRLTTAVCRSSTQGHRLCQGVGMSEVMQTDSEQLLREGVEAGVRTFGDLLNEAGWELSEIDKTFCHQVGSAHRRMMLDRLGVNPAIDFSTFQRLGNTGSAALPVALALGREEGWLDPNDRVALLGIGSGINCLMMG